MLCIFAWILKFKGSFSNFVFFFLQVHEELQAEELKVQADIDQEVTILCRLMSLLPLLVATYSKYCRLF